MRRSLRLAGRAAAAQSASPAVSGAAAATSRRPRLASVAKRRRVDLGLVRLEGSPSDAPSDALAQEKAGPAEWRALCSARELSCQLTLTSGQVFSWRKAEGSSASQEGVEWMGIVGRRVYSLRERGGAVECRAIFPADGRAPLGGVGFDTAADCVGFTQSRARR